MNGESSEEVQAPKMVTDTPNGCRVQGPPPPFPSSQGSGRLVGRRRSAVQAAPLIVTGGLSAPAPRPLGTCLGGSGRA